MTPYYQDALCVLYHGDCNDILSSIGPVSALITDPPYGCKRPSQWTGHRQDINGNDAVHASWIDYVELEDRGCAYVFTSWEVLEHWKAALGSRWKVRSCIVWDKMIHGLADLKTCWAPRHELILFAANGRHEFPAKRPIDVLHVRRTNKTSHPYEKPVELITMLIMASGPTSILDPFAGSGSTLLAAKECGVQCIGVELDERFCELAADRLSQRVLF